MKEYRDSKTHFASAPIEEIGERLAGKVSDYYAYLTSSALADLWRRAFYSYYGLIEDTALSGFGIFAIGRIRQSGVEGEMASIKVNHLRNLITHLLVLTTQQRPQLKCRAINSDSESLSQAYLGDGLVDYYMREKRIERYLRNAVELALIFGEGFIRIDWDERKGKEYGVGESGLEYEGDVTCRNYHPFDVIRDVTHPNTDVDWYITHDCFNRFDLAAKYPHASEQILNISTDITSGRRYVDPTKIIPAAGVGTSHTELIDVYNFIHKRTDSLPNGRYTVFLQDGTVLFDGPLAFKEIPIYRISASDLVGAPFGYTVAFDLLGIQQVIDKLYSIVTSNQFASGVQNFWQPPGNQLTKLQIAGGLNLLESVVKPEVLEMLNTPKEIFAFIERLEKIMETISGVSSVNRGEVPTTLKSGSSLAFVASQALTFSSDLQNSYNQIQESVGTGLIHILQDFVDYEKQAVIAGKFNRPIMRTFTGKDLSNVDRVILETTSSLSKTSPGKMQIAQDLLSANMIRNPREYLSVVTTGTLEPLYESEMSEIILIKAENEDMRSYKMPIMLASDDHKTHWLEHRAILANPDARLDVQLQSIVQQHMMEHFNMAMELQNSSPGMLAWMGEGPLPNPMQPPMPNQGPGQQVQPPPPNMAAMANAAPPMQQQAQEVNQPNMPGLPGLPDGADENAQEGYRQLQGLM
jgi:hypothetical protein